MQNRDITRLDMVKGATVLRQGHFDTLAFTPRNSEGEVVDLSGKVINVKIIGQKGIVYETSGGFDVTDSTLQFSISENIGHGEMWMEITVTDPADATYRQKFPTSEYEGKLFFIRSSDDLDYVGFSGKTVAQFEAAQTEFTNKMQQDFDVAVAAVTQDSEVALARMGEASLRAFNQKTTEKLAEKVPISEQVKGKPGQKFQLIAGTIRKQVGGMWGFVEDTAHAKTGLSSVASQSYDIKVNYDFTAAKVGTLVAAPDEQLAMRGVVCGSSVGTTFSSIRVTMPLSLRTKGKGTIMEIDPIMQKYVSATALADGSGYNVAHSAAVANNPNDVVIAQVYSPVGSIGAENESLEVKVTQTQSNFEVRAYSNFHGYVYYDTADSTVKVSTNNIKKPSVAWSTTTKSFDLTHEILNNPYDLTLTIFNNGLSSVYIPVVYSITTSVIKVQFRNIVDGSLLLAPDANMKFFYSSGNKVLNLMPSDMIVNVRRGPLTLRSDLFESDTGNIWLYGAMEIN